jgi:hypothetical protein
MNRRGDSSIQKLILGGNKLSFTPLEIMPRSASSRSTVLRALSMSKGRNY